MSVNELWHLSEEIIQSKTEVPFEIIRVFRRALELRKRLSKFYIRNSNESTHKDDESHLHFNCIFEQVLARLLAVQKRQPQFPMESPTRPFSEKRRHTNSFEYLESNADEEPIRETDWPSLPTASSAVPGTMFEAPGHEEKMRSAGSSILDDPLETITSIYEYLWVS